MSSATTSAQQKTKHHGLLGPEVRTVAILTTGRVNPAISPLIGFLMQRYHEIAPRTKLVAYQHGFRGLLKREKIDIGEREFEAVNLLVRKGGSPVGGSRVRLDNIAHLRSEGLIEEDEDPYEKCARILTSDKINALHVIGSGSAQHASFKIAAIAKKKLNWTINLVGLPKTIENDIAPCRITPGALSAAKGGALYFNNVVAEHNANPRMLIIHEIKGRAAGWLTAATALAYRAQLEKSKFAGPLGLSRENYDIHAIYTPEMEVDLESEIVRLRRCMDRCDNVNIFVAQGCFKAIIEAEATEAKKALPTHERLGYTLTQPAQWLADRLKKPIGAEKVLIQRSGIYVRAGAPVRQELVLSQSLASAAVHCALQGRTGVIGHDELHGGRLRPIEHNRIKGGKPFNIRSSWFVEMLSDIGQPQDVGADKIPFLSKL